MGQCPDCPRLGITVNGPVRCCLEQRDAERVIAVAAEREAFLEADRLDSLMLRIPGRDATKGEVTHKLAKDMNRKERRAFQSARNR